MLILCALATAADSSLPPVWRWPAGEVQRFHIETELVTPRGTRYNASENLDARAGIVKIRADTACVAKPEGRVNVVTCTLPYFSLTAQALQPDEGPKLDTIMAEWTQDILATTVEMELTPDGHLRAFDTRASRAQSTRREGYNLEMQRTLLQRTFAVFDLPMTTSADDWARGWTQKGSTALMTLQTNGGTVGAVEMKHRRLDDREGLLVIETTARGSLSTGSAVDASSGSRVVDVKLAGETLFDRQSGMVMWRDFLLDGQLMVSAQLAGSGREYGQVCALQWVAEFPEPGEIPPSISALRAPQLSGPPVEPTGEVVAFASLGMNPLFVEGHPEGARSLQLGKTKVKARVIVGSDGLPTKVAAYDGYAALGPSTESALSAARFPVRAGAYTVDVELEWRPTE